MTINQHPIHELPAGYVPAYHLSVLDASQALWLNGLSIVLAGVFFLGLSAWNTVIEAVRGPAAGPGPPAPLMILLVLLVLPLHEWVHGVFIRRAGHTPRYGMKGVRLGPVTIPVVLFATADDAYFRRDDFIIIALAPVVLITLGGMGLMILLVDGLAGYVALALIINGAGAVGDLWMTVVVLRYPADDTLVRDEADSITVFVAGAEGDQPADGSGINGS